MAVNVSQKDQTLNEIIDWCEQLEVEGLRLASALLRQHDTAATLAIAAPRGEMCGLTQITID